MIKTRKLTLAREVLVVLSSKTLEDVQGGTGLSAVPIRCVPSRIILCPPPS
jgi:hypothetical protein